LINTTQDASWFCFSLSHQLGKMEGIEEPIFMNLGLPILVNLFTFSLW